MQRNFARFFLAICSLSFALLLSASGCHKQKTVAAAPPKPVLPPKVSDVDLKSYKPNEAGAIMIIMYHRFNPKEKSSDLNRPPEEFKKDLEDFYEKGYRPVTVSDLVNDRMDVPPGKTPVVLTFDDALPTQFKLITGTDGQAHIDPDCAIGMMETFHKAHPDWNSRGTFFVLPKEGPRGTDPFGQMDSVSNKFAYLLEKGYEIANHTSTHPSLRRMSADKIQWELATAKKNIQAIAPQATMSVLALPYGQTPSKPADVKLLISGESGGTKYENKAVLRAAWRPVLSPVTKTAKKNNQAEYCVYDPFKLERITPDSRHPTTAGTLEYWLKFFEQNPTLRYISDGNPSVVAVPKAHGGMVDAEKVKKFGQNLQLYTFDSGKGGGLGTGLSVQ